MQIDKKKKVYFEKLIQIKKVENNRMKRNYKTIWKPNIKMDKKI